jgi:glycerol uptake facilitator-like aquaporin
MIIFTYGVTCPDSYEELDFQITIAILLGICFSGYMSGGNFNPGVTLMNFIRKDNKITLKMLIVYLVAQILGTFIGGSLGFAYNGAM